MKAVRSVEGEWRSSISTSRPCRGAARHAGHEYLRLRPELHPVREPGHPWSRAGRRAPGRHGGRRRGHLRLYGVSAMSAWCVQLVPDPRAACTRHQRRRRHGRAVPCAVGPVGPPPDGLDVRDASIVEPAAVSWHALRLAGTGPGTRVAVVGAGALGLLAVAGARRLGAEAVALEARHQYQKEAGERLGRGSMPTACSMSSLRRPERKRAWPSVASSSLRAGRSLSSASISARPAGLDAAVPQGGPGDPVARLLRP